MSEHWPLGTVVRFVGQSTVVTYDEEDGLNPVPGTAGVVTDYTGEDSAEDQTRGCRVLFFGWQPASHCTDYPDQWMWNDELELLETGHD